MRRKPSGDKMDCAALSMTVESIQGAASAGVSNPCGGFRGSRPSDVPQMTRLA